MVSNKDLTLEEDKKLVVLMNTLDWSEFYALFCFGGTGLSSFLSLLPVHLYPKSVRFVSKLLTWPFEFC